MVTWDDFDRIWARTSPLTPYEFSEPNYSQGWNFVGSTPPARQMWDSIQKKNDEKFKYLRDNFGTPNIVTSSSQMTDTEKVYVYMGSEAGWNSGHWYYYNEGTSSWEDGGVYNSVAFVTDTTLSIAGQPADAKATGDALALKSDLAGCTFTGNVSVNADFSVTGDSTLTGNVSASGDVNATGDVTADNISATTNGTIGGALSVAGDSALTNLSVSGTTALAGTSTAPTPSADDNSTKIATTEYVQTEIQPIETDVTINDKRITNIEKLLQGNLYDYQTDSTSAYTKSVPSGAMPYAGLEQIGGKTVVWSQLVQNGNFADGTNGWSTEHGTLSASSGVLTFSPTLFAPYTRFLGNVMGTVSGHKYYCRADIKFNNTMPDGNVSIGDGGYDMVSCPISSLNVWTKCSSIFTRTSGGMDRFAVYPRTTNFSAGDTVSVRNIFCVDLTLMFGAGNEPTAKDFETMFPADYYAYNAGTLLSAGVTEVVSKKADTSTIAAYSIPAEVQALEGYGWSAGTAYNYVDFERKVFVQNVGSIDLSTLNWEITGVNQDRWRTSEYAYWPNDISSVISEKYVDCTGMNADTLPVNGIIHVGKRLYVNNGSTVDKPTGMCYYALATPVEVDISEYLTDDNLIEVEAGGTLTFENQHGTDYQIPVPSEETYMIDLQASL